MNKPARTASKHFQETHNQKGINRKSSIVEATTNINLNQHLRRKSYRPGSAPVKLVTANTRGTGQSSREDSTTDVEKITQKENYTKNHTPTTTRPVSAATLKMRARRQQEGQVHLQTVFYTICVL